MPRAKRILFDNGVYHIVQRGHNRGDLFRSNSDYKKFKDIIRKYKKKFTFDIYHYCIMTNHFHFLLKALKGASLPKILQGITQTYSYYYRQVYGHCGYVYQNRYKTFIIDKDSYLLECGRYIERNPVRAGIVKDPADYPWSSYNYYTRGKKDDIVTTEPLFLELGRSVVERGKVYIDYVTTPRPYEELIDSFMLK